MANKVTNEDILQINSLYFQYKNYAEVARQTGFAASTVKKYIDPNWKPIEQRIIHPFNEELMPEVNQAILVFRGVSDYGYLCTLSETEKEEVKKLWEELVV